ncbi:MAG: EEP domain-containing protein, partial [Pseudobdellovibrionaceae bacterium]
MRLRVLTYNMHKGFCFYSRQYVIEELRNAIRAVDADIVFLQEVMGVH